MIVKDAILSMMKRLWSISELVQIMKMFSFDKPFKIFGVTFAPLWVTMERRLQVRFWKPVTNFLISLVWSLRSRETEQMLEIQQFIYISRPSLLFICFSGGYFPLLLRLLWWSWCYDQKGNKFWSKRILKKCQNMINIISF